MFPKWPEILRLAAVGFALTIAAAPLPAQAQDSRGGPVVQEPEPTSSGYAEAAEGLQIY